MFIEVISNNSFSKLFLKIYLFFIAITPTLSSQNNSFFDLNTEGVILQDWRVWSDSLNLQNPDALNWDWFSKDTLLVQKTIEKAPFRLWIVLEITNATNHNDFRLTTNALEKTTVFMKDTNNQWFTQTNGYLIQKNKNAFIFPIQLKSNRSQKIIVLVDNKKHYLSKLQIDILPPVSLLIKQTLYQNSILKFHLWLLILSSILLAISIYCFLQFYLSRKKGYLYYALFVTCSFLSIIFTTIEVYYSNYLFYFLDSISRNEARVGFMLGHIFQTYFYFNFFDFKKTQTKRLWKFFLTSQWICTIAYCLVVILGFSNHFLDQIRTIHNPILTYGGFVCLIFMFQEKKEFNKKIILFGSLVFVVLSIISFFHFGVFNLSSFILFSVGLFSEAICFWLALAVRDYETEVVLQQTLREVQTAFNKGQNAERVRVSADLHDEIGAALTNIEILSFLGKKESGNTEKSKSLLEKINTESKKTAESLQQLIWTMKSDNDGLEPTLIYLNRLAVDSLEIQNIRFSVQKHDFTEGGIFHLSSEKRRDLVLVFKECLTNITKHAQATATVLEVSIHKTQLTLTLSDNGLGFTPKSLTNNNLGGNGLKNMKARIEKHGGTLLVNNRTDAQGTAVEIRLPI